MMAKSKSAIALGAFALGLACTSASAANLIVNGSFEDPDISPSTLSNAIPTGWTKGGSAGDASIWRVGYADGSGNVTVAGEGQQFVTMGGGFQASGTTTWSQTVGGLAIGQAYQLDFKIAGEGVCCGTQSILVGVDGSGAPGQTFTASSPTGNYWKTWTDEGLSFVAGVGNVTVHFTYSGPFDMGLDDVRLTAAVPEPSTYVLMAAGLGLVGLASCRRKSRAA